MAGYPANGSMADVLEAMRDKLLQTSQLPYVRQVKIKMGPWLFPPLTNYQIYLEPIGSPEEVYGEHGEIFVKYAVHTVEVTCITPWRSPDEHDAIIGRSKSNTGLTTMVDHVCSYLENNLLGLSGLEPEYPPVIEAPDGAYQVWETDDGTKVPVCVLRWEGRTMPFDRPVDT